MSRWESFDEERKKHRSKDGPRRSRGPGWYWGGYWGGSQLIGTTQVPEPGDDGDHMGDQFSGFTESGADGGVSTGGDGGGGGSDAG